MKTVIIDVEGGNLQSVKNALDYLSIQSLITSDRNKIRQADRVIFPGQGHFGTVMQQLIKRDLCEVILDCTTKKPFLGICVGMQLLLQESEEAPNIPGLGLIKGTVKKFPSTQKIPQMGWNQVSDKNGSQYFYFANSYYCDVKDSACIVARTDYGISFPSVLRQNQLWAVQFHPEKSGEVGLDFLRTFVRSV